MSQIPLFSGMQQGNIPESVPEGLSKTQFVILRQLKAGVKNPKEIGKRLSMDKKDIESQIDDLKAKGYVTKDNKLTTKSMDILY
jgi:DNA-binding MarR family transcriptional regulator